MKLAHCLVPVLTIGVALLGVQGAAAAWHETFLGDGVAVHYVRLTGHGGDNEANRRNVLAMHQGCVDVNTAMGNPSKPLPAGGVPPVVSTKEIEIYYAANRTVTIKQGTLYDIDLTDCALVGTVHHIVEFAWYGGSCDADLIRKQARGFCDAAALAASAVAPLRPVSPNLGSEETRVVAGTPCQVHRFDPRYERCIAHPGPLQASNPNPIPAAPFNGGVRGLLLEANTPALTLRAQEVRMNLSVSNELFLLPPGMKINPGARR